MSIPLMCIKINNHHPAHIRRQWLLTSSFIMGELVEINLLYLIINSDYLEIFNRVNANTIQRVISAYAQNPPPFAAEQWWNPPPTLMAHPRSFASLAAKMVPPTCHNLVLNIFMQLKIDKESKTTKNLTCLRNGWRTLRWTRQLGSNATGGT